MKRTHENGSLSLKNVSEDIVILGWVSRKRHLGSLLFLDLRDRSGIVQVIVEDPSQVPDIRNEYVLQVFGRVRKKDVPNKNLKTGEIEVVAEKIIVVNESEVPPMIIDNVTDALEETRLKYRYLDLRRPIMQEKLKIRAKIVRSWHEHLDSNGFIEVETPILTLSTPGGARDYLIPSRLQHGSFYALPQSPQIYKQLLMIGGLEKYYQIARCFRDEDLRADRQPDFTQIDIEASFLDQEQLFTIFEQGIQKMYQDVKGIKLSTPFTRYTYQEVVENYGSDRPDLRFDLPLIDVKSIFKASAFNAFQINPYVKAVKVSNKAGEFSRKITDELSLEAQKFHLHPFIVLKVSENKLNGSFTKYLSKEEEVQLFKTLDLTENDVILIAASANYHHLHFGLGALRNKIAKIFQLIPDEAVSIFWVTDFPLFEENGEGKIVSTHHPFTRPRDEDIPLLDTDPLKVLAQAYDLVINGSEVGGGSMRIYNKKMQQKIFEILGMSEKERNQKFGWFIEAFNYGTPPHGGIAFGLERLVMILAKTENIRDVIAFPKNLSASGPLEKTPAPVDSIQLEELGIQIKEKK